MAALIVDNPVNLVREGQVADIPFITGDCDDEGTAFSLAPANLTSISEYDHARFVVLTFCFQDH